MRNQTSYYLADKTRMLVKVASRHAEYRSQHVPKAILPARRYASAGTTALRLCLSVSVTSRCSIETAERIGWFLEWELPPTCHILCYKEIQVP